MPSRGFPDTRDESPQAASHTLHSAADLGLDGTTTPLLAAVGHALWVPGEWEGTLTN